jgi:GntR family transcriptional regulator of vanillate catabolism
MPASEANKSANQSQKALMGLREMVLGGVLAPGERLFEVPLSERLGISRTPVREALSRLENEGLLERNPSGGYLVREFTLQDVIDAIELRGVLEGTAARLAAERGAADKDMAVVRHLLEQIDVALTPNPVEMKFDDYVELNGAFHARLAELSGSKLILSEINRAVSLPFASPSAFLHKQSTVPEFHLTLVRAQGQHRSLVDAIENREGSRAEAIAREHARLARSNLEFIVNNKDRSMMRQLPALALLSA